MKWTLAAAIALLLLSGPSLAQQRPYKKLWANADSSIFNQVLGQYRGKRKSGMWVHCYWTSAHTTPKVQKIEFYKLGIAVLETRYQTSGPVQHATRITRNLRGKQRTQMQYYNQALLRKIRYHGPTKRHVANYHSNGVLRSKGRERLGRLPGNVDAGLNHFCKEGRWLYYNKEGERIRVTQYERPKSRHRNDIHWLH